MRERSEELFGSSILFLVHFQHDTGCDDDEDCCDLDDDEIISTMLSNEEKFYPSALDKMIGSIALLLEEARDGP